MFGDGCAHMGDDGTLLVEAIHHAAEALQWNPQDSAGEALGSLRIGHGDDECVGERWSHSMLCERIASCRKVSLVPPFAMIVYNTLR